MIVQSKEICGGVPRIKNTRITVESVLFALSQGFTMDDILKTQKKAGTLLKKKDLLEALEYGSTHLSYQNEEKEKV